MKRRITMACMVGATLVVSACASESTEPKTPADTASHEDESADDDDNSGLSDQEFWEKVDEQDKSNADDDEDSDAADSDDEDSKEDE